MSGPTKTPREPWRAEKPERVPRKSRVDAATEILGEDQRSDVEVVLDRMDKESEKWKNIRFLDIRAPKVVREALRCRFGQSDCPNGESTRRVAHAAGMGYIVPELGIGTGKPQSINAET